MLTIDQLITQLKLQDRLNSVVNPDWLKAGNAWHRAMYVEAAEALDHYGWKWWKMQNRDVGQVHIELVDIWHFYLSWSLERHKGDALEAAGYIRFTLREGHTLWGNMPFPDGLDHFVASAAQKHPDVVLFTRLMEAADLSWSRLNVLYMGKNLLNSFRQEHGYKEGTYVKFWHDGQEDNVVLEKLLESRPNDTPSQIMNHLEVIYDDVLATSTLKGTAA
jgi:dimeric dUTPase (all-alpha-NTP-PPase superfamily)